MNIFSEFVRVQIRIFLCLCRIFRVIAVNQPYYWVSRFILYNLALHCVHAQFIFFTAEKAGARLTNSSEKATGMGIIHLEVLEIFLSKVLPYLPSRFRE